MPCNPGGWQAVAADRAPRPLITPWGVRNEKEDLR